jgi:Taurine catabolism dioxygenase TauD, TfdA family
MSLETINLTTRIGTEIRANADTLLTPDVAAEVRRLLIERGVLVFRKLNLTDEQQVHAYVGPATRGGPGGDF